MRSTTYNMIYIKFRRWKSFNDSFSLINNCSELFIDFNNIKAIISLNFYLTEKYKIMMKNPCATCSCVKGINICFNFQPKSRAFQTSKYIVNSGWFLQNFSVIKDESLASIIRAVKNLGRNSKVHENKAR